MCLTALTAIAGNCYGAFPDFAEVSYYEHRDSRSRSDSRVTKVTAQPPKGPAHGVLRQIDAVTVPVPDLVQGLSFYRDILGQQLLWRDDALGQAGLRLPDTDTEIVLSTRQGLEPNWLVSSVPEAVDWVVKGGGRVIHGPIDIPVGRVAVVSDPFGNPLVLVDLSTGRYTTDDDGSVIGVSSK
jgi:predicted enzyme related to lactoylglutathione lyase